MDEVADDGVIMDTDEDKIMARVRMTDETEVAQSAQADPKRL